MSLVFLSPSGGEIIFILVAVLMLFGAKKIPELARGLGKGIREIKNATSDIQKEVTKDVSSGAKEFKKIRDDLKDSINITKNDNT
ncbi:MAG: sec-independent protein translocase protein TatA [Saprospiraceae bacterium]|jgi:sec-independent protein translocase protein TatA